MKKFFTCCFFFTGLSMSVLAQQVNDTTTKSDDILINTQVARNISSPSKFSSPYKLNWKVDVPVIGAGIGLTLLGVKIIDGKRDLTVAELANKTPDRVPFFDRSNAGVFSQRADDLSYIPFQASFAMPVLVGLLNKNQRQNYGQVMVLYLETMAITGAMFTMTAGTVQRSRPFVYGNQELDNEYKMSGNNQRSFYAGHTAATAAATFYTAKVFNDFNPNSKARVYVWAAAAAVPALVGYWRYKAGMHFISDNLLGYAIGAATGILVPHFHKKKIKNLSVSPQFGDGYRGLAFTYKL